MGMNKDKQIEKLHKALNDLLALWITRHGWDANIVDESLKALKININKLPITSVFFKEYGGKL